MTDRKNSQANFLLQRDEEAVVRFGLNGKGRRANAHHPLEDADVEEELDKGDEEDDGAEGAEEEETLGSNFLSDEEGDAGVALVQEVGGGDGDPAEEVEAGERLEHEHGQRLLEGEADDDGLPLDVLAVAAGGPEDKDDHSEAKDGLGADGAVGAAGGGAEAVGGAKDEAEEDEPAETEAGVVRELEEGGGDAGAPGFADGSAEDGRGHIFKEEEADEEPCEDAAEGLVDVSLGKWVAAGRRTARVGTGRASKSDSRVLDPVVMSLDDCVMGTD